MTDVTKRARTGLSLTTALASGMLLFAPPAHAQTTPAAPPPAAPDDQAAPATQPDIVVTGSALPTTPDQVAVPVTTIGAEEIKRGGVDNNVLELVRKQIPSFAGRSNTGNSNANNTNQNTAGGSQAQLRNLDTLVLVNGRRMAVNPIAGMGGKVFVDLAQIPAAAIERVEVLTDGASAIYGSDAVGGVINFILKSDYEGLSVDGRLGFADGYKERSANFVVGHNFTDGFNITLAGSWLKSDPLYQNQRSFTSPFYSTATAVPGSVVTGGQFGVLAPGLASAASRNPTGILATAPNFAALIANGTYVNTPTVTSAQTSPATANSNTLVAGTGIGGTYDLSQYQTLLLAQEQKAFDASINLKLIGDDLVFFGDAQLSDNRSFTQFKPMTAGVTLPQNSPFNPVAGALGGVTFGSTADPKQYFNHTESLRLTAGFKGELRLIGPSWHWEAAYVHSVSTLTQLQKNVIFTPNLGPAIAGGYDANGNAVAGGAFSKVFANFSTNSGTVIVPALDVLSRSPNRTTLGYIFGTEQIHAGSKLDSFDGKITGVLAELPGGKLAVAFGGAYRKESLYGITDPNGYVHADPNYCNDGGSFTANAVTWNGGQSADPFPVQCTSATAGSRGQNSRTISSEFVEVRVPITGEDFNVPGLHEFDLIGAVRHEKYSDAGNSTVPKIGFFWQPIDNGLTIRGTFSKSFTAPPLYQEYGPVNFRQAGPGIIPAAFPGLPAGLSPVEDGVNPGLQPARATSYSLGVVFKPSFVPHLRFGIDYSFVKETGLPGGIGFSNIFLDVNQLGSASLFAGNIAKGNFPGSPGATPFTNPGDLRTYLAADPANYNNVYAIDRFTNLGGIRVRTLNGTIDYSLPTPNAGTFSFNSIMAVFLSYKFQALPSQKFYEYAGTATNGGTGVQGTLPKFRSYTSLNWNYHDVDLTIANTYISAVSDLGAGGITYETNAARTPPTAFAGRIKPYTTFDLRLAYTAKDRDGTPKGFSIAVGVNNVFNRMPPISTNVYTPSAAYTDNTADVSTYGPIGRLGYVQASIKF
ncbi:TonB-dependent receptor [Sphingomonas sp. AR_OL41]|uniref:TonB-dependent receptor plug domain-containing protein n=1 Tax=Sphingomonas sp. AR_OL41 TaxID=3042729 RepID=UPI00248136A5|nr:TonB-dependent receptor plug domain-containing protein [Sphingomonas sp. AR_OL41]MDH7974473.1 TonB-dependent receptor [Sphingomonas sp. AR_OL41]